jgi:hypothetical protein
LKGKQKSFPFFIEIIWKYHFILLSLYRLIKTTSIMKNIITYLFAVALLSAFTSVFATTPQSWGEFFLGFGVMSLFWGGMLAPVLAD